MTTYKLPSEPPVGTRVKDAKGDTWTHSESTTFPWQSAGRRWTWQDLLMDHGPLTLIEPDPWPTAPLIVADWTSGGQQGGRGLLYRETDGYQYWTIRENESVYPEHAGDTLTNVVPVTVVHAAKWEAMKSDHRTRSHLVDDCHVCALIAATDALGVAEG